MVILFPKDGARFSEGWEQRFRRMSTIFPMAGGSFTEGWETLFQTALPRDEDPFSEGRSPPLPRDGNRINDGWNPLSEGWQHLYQRAGDPLCQAMEPLHQGMGTPYRAMGTPFPKDGDPLSRGSSVGQASAGHCRMATADYEHFQRNVAVAPMKGRVRTPPRSL